MPTSIPLPEAVRGCWYYLPHSFDITEGKPESHQILCFGVDGSFARYDVEDDQREEGETGDYTFDGNFLILRGRRTDTFRVHRPAYWHWSLEGKKESFTLLRGFVGSEKLDRLPADECNDIRLVPRRARVEADFDGDDIIHRLIYERGVRDRRLLATFSVDSGDDYFWIGLTPLVAGIKPSTWDRVVRESYLGMFRKDSIDVDTATLHLFDSDESRDLAD